MRHTPLTQSGSISFNRSPLYILVNLTFTHSLTPPEVMQLINELNLGVEAIIIGTSPDLSDKAQPLYQVGLKNPIYEYSYVCNLVRKELSQHLSRAPEFIKRRGWNALCAMYPDRGCNVILWGISTEEFLARQYAATKKIGLYFAKAIISRAGNQGSISQHSSKNTTAISENITAISKMPFEPISMEPKDKFRKCTELSSTPQSKEAKRKATRNDSNDESASTDKPVSTDVTESSPAENRVTTAADGSASSITIYKSEASEVNENEKVKEKWYGGVGDVVRRFGTSLGVNKGKS